MTLLGYITHLDKNINTLKHNYGNKKAQKSIPSFASTLGGLGDKTIQNMDEEIRSEIDKNGGYVGTIFDYSLCITKRKFA